MQAEASFSLHTDTTPWPLVLPVKILELKYSGYLIRTNGTGLVYIVMSRM